MKMKCNGRKLNCYVNEHHLLLHPKKLPLCTFYTHSSMRYVTYMLTSYFIPLVWKSFAWIYWIANDENLFNSLSLSFLLLLWTTFFFLLLFYFSLLPLLPWFRSNGETWYLSFSLPIFVTEHEEWDWKKGLKFLSKETMLSNACHVREKKEEERERMKRANTWMIEWVTSKRVHLSPLFHCRIFSSISFFFFLLSFSFSLSDSLYFILSLSPSSFLSLSFPFIICYVIEDKSNSHPHHLLLFLSFLFLLPHSFFFPFLSFFSLKKENWLASKFKRWTTTSHHH